ncbi:MAG: dolichyl-phosphate beta-glucosyltransferase [Dehalococcoidia bacterium]
MTSVDIVIPVLNEEQALPKCIDTLRSFLEARLADYQWRIVVADNGSTDRTLEIAEDYARQTPDRVGAIHLDVRGRGRALKKAWLETDADVMTYMDVDLSTGLDALPVMVNAIANEGYHIAYGSRLAKQSRIQRGAKREVISRSYNLVIKTVMRTRFSDAQCGFKALSREAARVLLPVIINNHWFFDTELLVIGEKRGFRLKEVPVTWNDDPDTRVKIIETVLEDLKGLARLRLGGIPDVAPPQTPASGPPSSD